MSQSARQHEGKGKEVLDTLEISKQAPHHVNHHTATGLSMREPSYTPGGNTSSQEGECFNGMLPMEPTQGWIEVIVDKTMKFKPTTQSLDRYANMFVPLQNRKEPHPSIFKVKKPNEVAIATIGPCHRCKSKKRKIDESMKEGIVRFLSEYYALDIKKFLTWALDNYKRAHNCYGPSIVNNMTKEEFAEMLLMDGCLILFAIFILRSKDHKDSKILELADRGVKWDQHNEQHNEQHKGEPNDEQKKEIGKDFVLVSCDISLYMTALKIELLMLDNQIPFFVIEKLHESTTLFNNQRNISEMALSCFDDVHPKQDRGKRSDPFPKEVQHLLHLFHWSRVPIGKYDVEPKSFMQKGPQLHLPSASALRESATLFRKKSSGTSCCKLFGKRSSNSSPLDISFDSCGMMCGACGKMGIPSLYLCDYSKSIFQNLISFEQGYLRCGFGVTAYSACMSQLLQAEDDVRLLKNSRILKSTPMTDKEVIDFFRELTPKYNENIDITCIPKDLKKLYRKVTMHHNRRIARFAGGIMLQYFPSCLISFVVLCSILFTISTLVNNIHAIYRVYHPFKATKIPVHMNP